MICSYLVDFTFEMSFDTANEIGLRSFNELFINRDEIEFKG